MLSIDGSLGEGGGQIVRSSLALSLVTGERIDITNIRAGRRKPGLGRQHLTAVTAAATIGRAHVEGAKLGSARLSFEPHRPASGDYTFRVGTAGSATLVLQTVLPALLTADGHSTLTLEGGTHNPLAPPYEFVARAFLPLVNRMGATVSASLERHGFYPAGGGRITAQIEPAERLSGLDLVDRGEFVRRRVHAIVAQLPAHIARRECDTIARASGWEPSCFHVEEIRDASGPGNVVLIQIENQHVTEVITGFGQRGVRAERVAARAWREAQEYLSSGAPIGPYSADQLMLPLALAAHEGQSSTFRTMALTDHATTQIEIIQKFLKVRIQVESIADGTRVVRFG